MEIKLKHLIEGARQADGIAVIIDVFRAFSLECYLFGAGIKQIIPVDTLDKARQLKKEDSSLLLFGEREGVIQPDFDHGNSPSQIKKLDLAGQSVVHASSSGTRGLVAAMNSKADQVLTGCFVNAQAIASYIKAQNPDVVTLVDMGWAGRRQTLEDSICANYILSLITGQDFSFPDFIYDIFQTDGKRFFLPENQNSMPMEDFFLCLRRDIFPFIIKAEVNNSGNIYLRKSIIG